MRSLRLVCVDAGRSSVLGLLTYQELVRGAVHMPFTVDEFRDLIRLLEERPEWRAELRYLLLTNELLSMPEQLAASRMETDRRFQELAAHIAALTQEQRQLAQEQHQLAQQVAELTQQVAELTRRLDDLTQQVAELTRRLDDLTQQVAELTRRLDDLTQQVAELTRRLDDLTQQVAALTRVVQTIQDDVGELKGDSLERRYRERAPAYFARLIRRTQVLTVEALAALLDEAVARGSLSEAEAEDVTWADLVVRGRRREDGAEVYLVVEISWGIGLQDVERAARRAELLTRVGLQALPVVAGKTMTDEAIRLADTRQVRHLTNGQTL